MKKLLVAAVAASALAVAATATAALDPGVLDATNSGCVTATYSKGVLHVTKNCKPGTAEFFSAAGAGITGLAGQTFQSASFTLASASQCLGGSPRFNVYTTTGTYFLGCNNVTPATNPNGTVTYTFSPTDLRAANGSNTPAGTLTSDGASILIDQNGTADITNVFVNGVRQLPVPGDMTSRNSCKHGGWKRFTTPKFKNQGQCVAFWNQILQDVRKTLTSKHKTK